MHAEFWLSRWQEGKIGFHGDAVHADLLSFGEGFLAGGPHRVLVPLCGKTVDLAWLAAQGHDVVGVELSPIAAESVFAAAGLEPVVDTVGPFTRRSAGGLAILQGDVFAATPELLGPFDRVWDRAAIVAITADQRRRYAATIAALLRPGGVLLQNAFAYDQVLMDGPPFSVTADELGACYPGWSREHLRSERRTEGKFTERGLPHFDVSSYRITRPG